MRNLTFATEASFQAPSHVTVDELPIALQWRSSLWRYIVPGLWVVGCMFWIWVVSIETPRHGMILYALIFVGVPLILALSGYWWVLQLLRGRAAATLAINGDYLEWQFEADSEVELLTDCSQFAFVGKRNYDARIEWDSATSMEEMADGWPRWMNPQRLLSRIKSSRTLYARDVGLDRDALESLCKLLNQLRDGATARA